MKDVDLPPIVELVSGTITIWDERIGSIIYSRGFFGKPLGLRKTKPGNQHRPLTLSLFDALYLLEHKIIRIIQDGKNLTQEEFIQKANDIYENFDHKYNIYSYLRSLGYVVRPGMKFGSDFAIYKIGPGFDHSKWVVHVENDKVELKAINIVRAGRLAASVKKQYLIATSSNEGKPNLYSFDRMKI